MGFELTTAVMIGTDCTGSCKTNYHTIMTTTAHKKHLYNVLFFKNVNNIFLNLCVNDKFSINHNQKGVIPLIGLTPPNICACPKIDFQSLMLLTFYIELFEVRGRGVIVHFVDICGIVDHQSLNFLFIRKSNRYSYHNILQV